MIGFGCTALQRNRGCRFPEKPPVVKLVGNKLIKRDVIYKKPLELLPNINNGIQIGFDICEQVGIAPIHHLGICSSNIGHSATSKISKRAGRVLGDKKAVTFGKHNIDVLGMMSSKLDPPETVKKLVLRNPPTTSHNGEIYLWMHFLNKANYKLKKFFLQLQGKAST